MVQTSMLGAVHDLKVDGTVVGSSLVSVVNYLEAAKLSSNRFFGDESVFRDILAAPPEQFVTPVDGESLLEKHFCPGRSWHSVAFHSLVVGLTKATRMMGAKATPDSALTAQAQKRGLPRCAVSFPAHVVRETKTAGTSRPLTFSNFARQSSYGSKPSPLLIVRFAHSPFDGARFAGANFASVGNPCHRQNHSTEEGEKSCPR